MGLALVPPMYAWFTTLGFWDPYDNTGNIKVAVASEDAGYTSDLIPTPINAGEQIIGKLRANDQFAWQFVSAEAAVEGVRSGEYYAALVIPKEFSRDLMTVFSDDITEPKIIYYDNEKENATIKVLEGLAPLHLSIITTNEFKALAQNNTGLFKLNLF